MANAWALPSDKCLGSVFENLILPAFKIHSVSILQTGLVM